MVSGALLWEFREQQQVVAGAVAKDPKDPQGKQTLTLRVKVNGTVHHTMKYGT